MDTVQFVSQASQARRRAAECARCQRGPTLCTTHVLDLVAVRRERVATLLKPGR